MTYKIPADVSEQTRRLIESGVAERALRSVQKTAGYEQTPVGDCQFWARVLPVGPDVREPELQVVIGYPSRREDDPYPRYGCAVTVETEENPWFLADGEELTAEQIAVVRSLAPPPWMETAGGPEGEE